MENLLCRRVLGPAFLLLMGVSASTVSAQWSVTNLHPAGATSSVATSVHNGQQGGYVTLGSNMQEFRASIWSSSAASWVNLHPQGRGASFITVVRDGQQGGNTWAGLPGTTAFAATWTGTTASWVGTQNDTQGQRIQDIRDGQLVGAYWVGANRACLWNGSLASSFVNLHPAGSTDSFALGVSNGQQVGSAIFNGVRRAGLWSGTSETWEDLHPAGATISVARGIFGDVQAGYAIISAIEQAGIWRGSASSWNSLHPDGATQSTAFAIHDRYQVGSVTVGGIERASLWTGCANTWEDLSLALDESWTSSQARGIWSDGSQIYVVGFGFNQQNNRNEAILWTRPILPDICLGDIADDFGFTAADGGGPDGQVDFGDFVALLGLIGPCDGGEPGCLGDIADEFGFTALECGGPDGVVDFGDFVALLGLIGPCP